jgi:Fe-S cluster assembly iron-binding protein IscA
MLTLTENASTIVKDIAATTGTEGAGLRITADPATDSSLSLSVTTSDHAEPGDQVVEQSGATVYLEDQVAEALSEMVLDAGVDPAGNLEFALAPQA